MHTLQYSELLKLSGTPRDYTEGLHCFLVLRMAPATAPHDHLGAPIAIGADAVEGVNIIEWWDVGIGSPCQYQQTIHIATAFLSQ